MKSVSIAPKRKCLLTWICAIAITSSTLLASQTEEAFKELEKAVEKEVANRKVNERPSDYHPYGDISVMSLMNLKMAISRDDRNIDHPLSQLRAQSKSEEVKQAIAKLQTALQADRNNEEAAFSKKLQTTLADTTKAIRNAKKPADLDETFTKLETLRKEWDLFRQRFPRNSEIQIDGVWRFTGYWQDYLANEANGRLDTAINNLENASREQRITLLPRSEILERIDLLKKAKSQSDKPTAALKSKIQKIIRETKSLDAIPQALDALAELEPASERSGNRDRAIASANRELNALLQAYREYQADLPLSLDFRPGSANQSYDAYADTLHLRVELIRLAAPRILKASNLKPKQDESITHYLDRVMEKAQETADVRLISRVHELRDKLIGRSRTVATRKQLQTTLAGQNQEEAGQWMLAVISYQEAIRNGSDLVPVAALSKRLEAIKVAHPEEYQKAMEYLIKPAPTTTEEPTTISVEVNSD